MLDSIVFSGAPLPTPVCQCPADVDGDDVVGFTDVVQLLSRVQIEAPEAVEEAERKRREAAEARMRFTHAESSALNNPETAPAGAAAGPTAPGPRPGARQTPASAAAENGRVETFVREERKVGRNEPCPCGSGKKYKQCHGKAS